MPTQILGTTGVNQVSFGTVLQIVEATPVTSAVIVTETIPLDSTIPQITEGKSILTATLTPKKANSRVRVRVLLPFIDAGGTAAAILALFVAGGANAVAVGNMTVAAANYSTQVQLEYEFTVSSLTPVTFEARLGTAAGNTLYLNRRYDGSNLGLVAAARMSITEVQA